MYLNEVEEYLSEQKTLYGSKNFLSDGIVTISKEFTNNKLLKNYLYGPQEQIEKRIKNIIKEGKEFVPNEAIITNARFWPYLKYSNEFCFDAILANKIYYTYNEIEFVQTVLTNTGFQKLAPVLTFKDINHNFIAGLAASLIKVHEVK